MLSDHGYNTLANLFELGNAAFDNSNHCHLDAPAESSAVVIANNHKAEVLMHFDTFRNCCSC